MEKGKIYEDNHITVLVALTSAERGVRRNKFKIVRMISSLKDFYKRINKENGYVISKKEFMKEIKNRLLLGGGYE